MSKLTRQWICYIIAYLLPFIAVWVAWLLTAMSFDIHQAFSGNWWYFSGIWWFLVACCSGLFFPSLGETE